MAEYIKREDAIRAIMRLDRVATLNKVPAADVVEVVRCKDCEHYEPYPTVLGYELGTDGCCTAPWLFKPFRVQENHYCSWGKRKEAENE